MNITRQIKFNIGEHTYSEEYSYNTLFDIDEEAKKGIDERYIERRKREIVKINRRKNKKAKENPTISNQEQKQVTKVRATNHEISYMLKNKEYTNINNCKSLFEIEVDTHDKIIAEHFKKSHMTSNRIIAQRNRRKREKGN